MQRLTKSEIQRKLLAGESIEWTDASKKRASLQLSEAKKRRLFEFLLSSAVREPTGLPETFVKGLEAAFDNNIADPAASVTGAISPGSTTGPWQLLSIETEGFGGLNSWNGSPFSMEFDGESYLLEGPNGSGKSSLVGAAIWALTGERPRDQSDPDAHEPKPVYGDDNKVVGEWPPIACYPPTASDLKAVPDVRVKITFVDLSGEQATVERKLCKGVVTTTVSPNLSIPPILVETGLLMPARMPQLRFDDGGGRLTDAVQQLTGLDDLIALGGLVDGLCHKSREYRAYRSKEFATLRNQFDQALNLARSELHSVGMDVPQFKIKDTDDPQGEMAQFGKNLTQLAARHATTISSDIKSDVDISQIKVQNEVIAAIASARAQIASGLIGLPAYKHLCLIAENIDEKIANDIQIGVATGRDQLAEADKLRQKADEDSRFQLKALGAQWHAAHKSGPIESCPLCQQTLKDTPALAKELNELQAAGEAATKTFKDNVNSILVALEANIPEQLRNVGSEILTFEPRTALVNDIKAAFVDEPRYANILIKIAAHVGEALNTAPTTELTPDATASASVEDTDRTKLSTRLVIAERLIALKNWYEANSQLWLSWWQGIASDPDASDADANEGKKERLIPHLDRLSESLEKSGPYRKGAIAMRDAWRTGQEASKIEKVVEKRNEIADCLQPLKSLGSMCESVTREAIEGLSGRIEKLLGGILIAEQLQYKQAALDRKEGLVIHAGFASPVKIDATLIANTSWLRAVLWAFVFALREEAVEQFGHDALPLLILDDPQSTFDTYHRARWAQYIAALQNGPPKIQVVLATYEENFIDLVRADGILGRQALVVAPGPSCDHVSILEGAALERAWAKAQFEKTPAAAVEYLEKVRIYLEGLLKLMLRGEDADVRKMALGDLRDLLDRLKKGGRAPWDNPAFAPLISHIRKSVKEIAYIEGAHHTTGRNFGMAEAQDAHAFWRSKLGPALDRAFRVAREHRLLHGGKKALYPLPTTVVLPEGYQEKIRTIPLNVIGRAAALTDGRVADGNIGMDEFSSSERLPITLGKHSAYRLVAQTMEPVARPGDILITRDYGDISNKSLVIAIGEDRILARRFEITENHSDVAVLTAQAINPREIAPPVVIPRGSLTLHKVIGVLFATDTFSLGREEADEVCDCGGEAALKYITSNTLGLVEVEGRSAEPVALDQQYIIVKAPISPDEAKNSLDGIP